MRRPLLALLVALPLSAAEAPSRPLASKRWPEPLAKALSRLEGQVGDDPRAHLLAALDHAEAWLAAPDKDRKAAAAAAFKKSVQGLGMNRLRYMGRSGGLGEIARDILGDKGYLDLARDIPIMGPANADLGSLRAEAFFAVKEYGEAAADARAVLRLKPEDRKMATILRLSEGRGGSGAGPIPSASALSSAKSPPIPAPPIVFSAVTKRPTSAPPTPALAGGLDPKDPGFWDKQLLKPLLTRSDGNPVAARFLSPMIRARKVTIRLEPMGTRGPWGTYDPGTGVITYNMDQINLEILGYNHFMAAKTPPRKLALIRADSPLDKDQVDFLTRRFLPLAVHEAGGHGRHADALRTSLGTRRAPINKDSEIMAFRIEAASVQAERTRDPSFLTEDTKWARAESHLLERWKTARLKDKPILLEWYLNRLGYADRPMIGGDLTLAKERYSESVSLVQSHCRTRYDAKCRDALDTLTAILPPRPRSIVAKHRARLAVDPHDRAELTALLNLVFQLTVVFYRLDPKGLEHTATYFREEERRVARIEALVAPRSPLEYLGAHLSP